MNGITGSHVAYIITSSYKQRHLAPWMDALNKSLLMVKSDWHPNAFIADALWVFVSKHGHIFYCMFMLPSYVFKVLHVLESCL
jgi:hypothetical protein